MEYGLILIVISSLICLLLCVLMQKRNLERRYNNLSMDLKSLHSSLQAKEEELANEKLQTERLSQMQTKYQNIKKEADEKKCFPTKFA